ncbi:MAG TPA: glycoside hydrolase family 13 protein [Acidimicrobiia bacterium]|nr:glycoside hydrolase family 13 protein [Acidimicrobiia bacterium]
MSRPQWVPDAVFYQIFPDRFRNGRPDLDPPDVAPWGAEPDQIRFQGGDLRGINEGLSHLEWLGASAIYLNPIFTAGTNHRYDTHDYFGIDPRLGDLGEFRELVAEAHRRGIRVVLDGVFNHCGDGHPAFVDWNKNRSSGEHAGWFLGWPGPQPAGEPDYQTCGGASYLPKLNTNNPAVKDHLLRCATYWVEKTGIDGWRLDVPWKVEGGFWDDFMKTMETLAPDVYVVGEMWRDATGYLDVFDGCMNYQQRAAILDYCLLDVMDGEDFMIEIEDLLRRHGAAAPWMLNLIGSHDTSRVLTLADGDIERVCLAFTALFTLPGSPMIYYGDEVGLTGSGDPSCRKAMPWDPDRWDTRILEHVRTLTAVRGKHDVLRRGALRRVVERNGMAIYRRQHEHQEMLVVINPRGAQQDVRIEASGERWRDLLSDRTYPVVDGEVVIDQVAAKTSLILVETRAA